jgi:hypothetical protein
MCAILLAAQVLLHNDSKSAVTSKDIAKDTATGSGGGGGVVPLPRAADSKRHKTGDKIL